MKLRRCVFVDGLDDSRELGFRHNEFTAVKLYSYRISHANHLRSGDRSCRRP